MTRAYYRFRVGCITCQRQRSARGRGGNKVLNSRRVEDPSDGVVDRLALRERLVSALVGNNPEARREEADKEGVERPEGEARGGVEVGAGEREVLWGEERVEVAGGGVKATNDDHIHDTGEGDEHNAD